MNNNKDTLNFERIKSVLFIRLSSLGDILLSTPLVRSLKNKYPQITTSYLVKKQYKDALKLNPFISRLYLYDSQKEKIDHLMGELKTLKFDLILDLQNNFRSNQIANSLDIKTLKFQKRTFDKFLLVNFKINRLKGAPGIPERYAEIIPGLKLDDQGLDLYTDKKNSPSLEGKHKLVGIAPGSRHFTKMWPAGYYVFLGRLIRRTGYDVVLFGGSRDTSVCSEISEKIEDAINLCNDDDLLQTASDIKKCSAIVCNDSGMMHTACAAKVPVLAFFGSTVKEFGFTPYKNRNLILENNSLTCRPCSHIGRERCPKGHFRCLLEISPEKAFEVLMSLINS